MLSFAVMLCNEAGGLFKGAVDKGTRFRLFPSSHDVAYGLVVDGLGDGVEVGSAALDAVDRGHAWHWRRFCGIRGRIAGFFRL